MSQLPNVVIIMGRCGHDSHSFGMRFEEKEHGTWTVDWAFPIQESVAKKEGYDHTEIKGNFATDNAYPGCPYCHLMDYVLCFSCNKVSCYDGHSATTRCGWCGSSLNINGTINTLSAGDDLL